MLTEKNLPLADLLHPSASIDSTLDWLQKLLLFAPNKWVVTSVSVAVKALWVLSWTAKRRDRSLPSQLHPQQFRPNALLIVRCGHVPNLLRVDGTSTMKRGGEKGGHARLIGK